MDKEMADALKFMLRASVLQQIEDIIATCQRIPNNRDSRVAILTRIRAWFPLAVAKWQTTTDGAQSTAEDVGFVVGLVREMLDELIQKEGN